MFFEGGKDVRSCAGVSVAWTVVGDVTRGVCGERLGYLWCVGVSVLVGTWEKVVVAFEEVVERGPARRQPKQTQPQIPARWRNFNLPDMRS